jgi:SAM-dependent methyltransferase
LEALTNYVTSGAINRARERSAHLPNVHFEQSDMLHLPKDLNGRFDLVLVLDVLYYLLPLDAELLKQLAERTADLLVPGGLCVLGACRGVSIGRSKTLRTSVSSPSTAGPSSWSVSSRLLPVQHFRNITHFPKLLRDANRDHWPCNLFFASKEARNLHVTVGEFSG